MKLQDLKFGIEIETVANSRVNVAYAVQSVVGGRVSHGHGYAGSYVHAADGRTWKIVRDSSVTGGGAEIVSPILRYGDLETLQDVVRAVRAAGAKVDSSCGIHIHVDAAAFDAASIVRLVKNWGRKEELIKHALGTLRSRGESYCWDLNKDGFLNRLYSRRQAPKTLDELNQVWYNRSYTYHPEHYNSTRYHALNLHNIWFRGTVEFRLFNSTLHAGKIKAYIQFVLAIAAFAINSRSAARANRCPFNPATAKYDFRTYLLRLGLIGDEFKTCRLHLTKHLSGNASWKNGRPASPEDTIIISDEIAA